MKKKTIASFFDSISFGGGVELVQASMSLEFVKKGYDFTHILLNDKGNRNRYSGKIINLNRKFIFGFGFKKIFELFIVGKKISNIAKKDKIDVFLGHGDFFYLCLCISKIFYGNKSKIVGVMHSTLSYWPKILQVILMFFLKKCDLIVVLSNEELNYMRKLDMPKNKIKFIPNGLDISKNVDLEITPQTLDNDILGNGKFTFINIGRLTPQKNHKFLIDCFDDYYKKEKNIQLLVLGDGELMNQLSNYKDGLECGKDIYFLGNKKDIFRYLQHSDCFFLSSIYEGFGMVLLEAMMKGLPIISTRCPSGPKEILQGKNKSGTEYTYNAILIDSNDIKQGSLAMEELYSNHKLQKTMGQENLKRVKFYSLEKSISKWIINIEKL